MFDFAETIVQNAGRAWGQTEADTRREYGLAHPACGVDDDRPTGREGALECHCCELGACDADEGVELEAARRQRRRIDFGKRLFHAFGDEDGVIAEAVIAAGRKRQAAMHFAFECTGLARRQRHA